MSDVWSGTEADAAKADRRTTRWVDTWTLASDRPRGWGVLDEVPTASDLAEEASRG